MPDSNGVSSGAYKLRVYMEALTTRYGRCVPSNRAMAAHFGVCKRTVQRWKRELEAKGWLRQQRRQRPHHREQASCYSVRDLRTKCRWTQMSPPNVTPSLPLRGTLCSSEREQSTIPGVARRKIAAVGEHPSEADIDEVRNDWGRRQIDRAAILKILRALAMRNCTYVNFRHEAARRVKEVQPNNRVGFVIRLAESGQFYGEPERSIEDQAAAIKRVLQRS